MASSSSSRSCTSKPHVLCIPFPAQGHINPMLKLAKLLHHMGFHITFVHTEFHYHKLALMNDSSTGDREGALKLRGLDDFRFEAISDGLPPSNPRGILDLPSLCLMLPVDGLHSFRELVKKLMSSDNSPPVTCIVSDGVVSFTIEVAQEFGIPEMVFFTPSGCDMLGYLQFEELVRRGLCPLKDESCLSNGYLDAMIDWIPAMKNIRLRDLPTFIRTVNPDDIMFNYNLESVNNALKAKGVILNTFDALEEDILQAIKDKYRELYTIGPLPMLHQRLLSSSSTSQLEAIQFSLWKEDKGCLDWLDGRSPKSVLYVNFGSLITMTEEQLREFAWGLVNSKYWFLWVIRPNMVTGGEEIMSDESFKEEVRNRGLIAGWCPQERVLGHPSIGGFLTHCGWNSTLESICHGVPLICWPFFAEQQMNCLYSCTKWGVGLEIDSDVKREKVEDIVRELMEGERGRKVREKATEWKRRAEAATGPGGSSNTNFDRLISKLQGP